MPQPQRTIMVDLTIDGQLDCRRGIILNKIDITTTPYNILITDHLIAVNTSSLAITVTLPTASVNSVQVFYIMDATGNANTNSITVTCTGGDTINGNASITLNQSYHSITVCNVTSTSWNVV